MSKHLDIKFIALLDFPSNQRFWNINMPSHHCHTASHHCHTTGETEESFRRVSDLFRVIVGLSYTYKYDFELLELTWLFLTLAQKKAIMKRRQRKKFLVVTMYIATAIVTHAALSSECQPMHTSEQTGQRWLDELLSGIISFLEMPQYTVFDYL
jgi:hypothetical protein